MACPDGKMCADYTVHSACSVPGCYNSGYRSPELHFHAFPAHPTRRSQWIAATKRDSGPTFQIKKGSTYVCSAHFKPEDYKWTPVRKSLKADAVPRIFTHCEGWEDLHSGQQTSDTKPIPSMADCATQQLLSVPWLSPDVKQEPPETHTLLLLKEEPPEETPISSVKTEFEDGDDGGPGEAVHTQQDERSDAGDPSPGVEDSAVKPQPHRCSDCVLSFGTAFQLTEHRRLHTGERPYKCVQCGKMFCHLANYQQHLERHDQEPKSPSPRLCPACGDTLPPHHSLEHHLATHCQPHKCAGCKSGFSTLEGYQKHLRRYGDHRRHKCPDCGRGFKKRTYMVKHQLRCPKREPPGGEVPRRAAGRGSPLPRKEPPRCPGCNRSFSSPGVFRRHRCNPFKIHCYACGSYFGCYRQYESHKRGGEAGGCPGNSEEVLRRNACPRCGSASHTFQGADPRLWAVAGGLATCRLCRKGFRFPCQLEPHHRMHESKQEEEDGPQGKSKGIGAERERKGSDSEGEEDGVSSEGWRASLEAAVLEGGEENGVDAEGEEWRASLEAAVLEGGEENGVDAEGEEWRANLEAAGLEGGEENGVDAEGEEWRASLEAAVLEGGEENGVDAEGEVQREGGSEEEEGLLKCFDCGQLFGDAEILHEHYMQHARGEL